ncbi:hypothetical protein ACTA71_005423 [Dictyostelium dimigraforme]
MRNNSGSNNNNFKYKIVLFGDYWDFNGEKKFSYRRFGDDDDDESNIDNPIQFKNEFRIKNIEIADSSEMFKLFIYDVDEYSEGYIYCKDFYFKGVDGYILVYNPLNNNISPSSFESIKKLFIEIKKRQSNFNWKDWFSINSWINWFNDNDNGTKINTSIVIIVVDKTHLKENDQEYEKIKIFANYNSIQLIEITNSNESTNQIKLCKYRMDKLLFSDANEKDLKLIENSKVVSEIDDLFPYAGCPSYQFNNINQFKEQLIKDNQLRIENVKEEELKVKITEHSLTPSDKNNDFKYVYCRITSYLYNKATIKVTRPDASLPLTNIELLAIYSKAWQWIYQEEEKEVGNPGNINGMLNRASSNSLRPDVSLPLTNIELLAIYSKVWRWIYNKEGREVGYPSNIPGMLNRAHSNYRYGISGEHIADLVYNGEIKIYYGLFIVFLVLTIIN